MGPAVLLLLLTINSIFPQVINSPDDSITVSASASGLSNSTQYLQAAFTKEGETTHYFGLTQNLADEWYLYESTPSVQNLSAYFYSFTPANSTWSGQLKTRLDTNSKYFLGPGNYILKLYKYISSSGTASNNSITVVVNVASTSATATPATQSAQPDSPTLDWALVDHYTMGEKFSFDLALHNFAANQPYYVKLRGGKDTNSLTKLQTINGDSSLSDNESWISFPLITTNSDGYWRGSIFGVLSEDKDDGDYQLYLRLKKQDADTFYESDFHQTKFVRPPVDDSDSGVDLAAIIDKLSSSASRASTSGQNASSSAGFDLVLGTTSANFFAWPTATAPAKKAISKPVIFDWLPLIFFGGGFVISVSALGFLVKKRFFG